MAASTDTSTTLELTSRAAEGSRSARRLRRTGQVPGILYGGERRAASCSPSTRRILRNTLGAFGRDPRGRGRRRRHGARARQGHPAPPGARRGRARRLPARGHEGRDPDDGHARAARRRSRAGRRRGRRALAGRRGAQHRGAPGRHPGLDPVRRLRARDERDRDARAAHRAGRRHAARRPRRDRPGHDHPADAGAGRGGDRDRDRAGRRGRGRRGRRPRATRARRPSSRPPTASPEALLLRTGRLADRRPREPRGPLRRHAAQRRLPGRRRADRALGPAQAEEEVRRRAAPRAAPGRAARASRCSSRRRT